MPLRGMRFAKLFWWKIGQADNIHEYVQERPEENVNIKSLSPESWNDVAFIQLYELN